MTRDGLALKSVVEHIQDSGEAGDAVGAMKEQSRGPGCTVAGRLAKRYNGSQSTDGFVFFVLYVGRLQSPQLMAIMSDEVPA